MGGRIFGDEDIRDIVASMEQPTVATRGANVLTVNEPWLRELGFRREDIEGKPIGPLVATGERERLLQRALLPDDQVRFDKALRTLAKTADGRVLPVRVHSSRFQAKEPPDYRVVHIVVEADDGGELTFARELLALSAELIDARNQHEVRTRTCAAFERSGFVARFWKEPQPTTGIDEEALRSALAERRPVFVGAHSAQPEAVYVPLEGSEVLFVAGPGLSGQHAFTFGFFAKLVSTALLDVQASEAARRKLSDTQLVLQLARTTSETLDLDAVMSVTADLLVQLLDVSSCFILLYDKTGEVLRGRAASHGRRAIVSAIDIPLSDANSIAAEAGRTRRPIVIPDTSVDERAKRSPRTAMFHEAAVAALPIVSRAGLEGVVILDDTRGPRPFEDDWIQLASAMSAQVGLSIANAKLYESLRASYDELAHTRAEMVKHERLAGLGELAAIVAHEVRNPVGVIYNASSSLRRLVEGSTDGSTLVDIVREECERLNQIVGDLLDFARPRQLSLQAEEVPRMLSEVIEALGAPPNVRFDLVIADGLPMLVIDRRLIRQALVNVALNAVQAMPHGGALRLSASVDALAKVAVIEITDEGPGIAIADFPRIFEPFFTTKATGAGLGLAVVKRIVEDHGGEVSASSSSKGTTFHFRLPLVRGNERE